MNNSGSFSVRFGGSSVGLLILLIAAQSVVVLGLPIFFRPIGASFDASTIVRSDKIQRSPEAAFITGNLAVLRTDETDSNSPASVIEVNPATPASNPVQSLAIPGTGATGLRFSASATSTGYIANTNDGTLLAFMGANSADTAANVNTLNPRAVGTLNGNGNYTIATTYTGSSGNQTRCSTSLNNSNWFIADQGGIYTNGSAAASPTGNVRGIKSFGGTVYTGQASSTGTVIQVSTVSAPSGGTITGLPGLTNNANFQDFYLVQSGSNGAAFDILYTVSATSNTVGTISKFSLVGGSWLANGTYTTTFGGFGLAAAASGGGAFLYLSTGQGALAANSVIRLTDTAGFNSTLNINTPGNLTLYTAPAGTILKGVAFAPVVPANAPEANIQGNGLNIPDGDTSTSTADGTDLGDVNTGSFLDRSFTIQNTGSADLTLGAITFTGTNPSDFAIQNTPISPVLPAGSTSVTIRFFPGGTGLRQAKINIVNSDGDENPYDFDLAGNGVGNSAPTISENTASAFISLPGTGPGTLSGVIGDVTDPGKSLGVDFDVNDVETPASSLDVTATSSNTAVVSNANLSIAGGGSTRNLKINPTAEGYTDITITVTDGGSLSANYIINYAASVPGAATATTQWHTGKADASTAQAVDANYMFVADDEDQGLRLYDRNNSGLPLATFDFTANLALTDPNPANPREVDIEASARTGNRIFWLASHSNSSGGANRPNRSRLFATDIAGAGAASTLTYVGRYDFLKNDLIAWDQTNVHGLGANHFGFAASAAVGVIPEAPDGSGFNIEGLEFAPDGTTGYVSFRAPISPAANRTKALIVPVTNITALTAGLSAGSAVFGTPIELDLGGRGIRELRKNAGNEYVIIGGSASSGTFAIYSWDGNPASVPALRSANLTGLNPESVLEVPAGLNSLVPEANVDIEFLSDNGDDIYYNDGVIAKELPNNALKKFRSDTRTISSPTAAGVKIIGRLLDRNGNGVGRGRVTLTRTSNGSKFYSISNQFGYFTFDDLEVGESYVITVESRSYIFAAMVIDLVDQISELEIVALP